MIIGDIAPATDLIPCNKWTFTNANMKNNIDTATIVSEWNLVCDNSYLLSIAETGFLIGAGFGGFCSGMVSDRYGRRTALAIFFIIQTIVGVSIVVVPWLIGYIILRTLLGFVSVAVVFSAFVLSLELVGGVWRTVTGVSYLFPVSLSYPLVAGISYLIQDNWRHIQLAISLPALLLFAVLFYPITESPRWLLTAGRRRDYYKVLNAAARFNNRPEIIEDIHENKLVNNDSISDPYDEKPGLKHLFRTKQIRYNTMCLFVIWFSVYLVYFGLTLNMSNLAGDLYVNSALSGLVEIPALAASILFLIKLGRRWPLCLTLVVGGLACLSTMAIPTNSNYQWIATALAMLGKLSFSSSNAIMPIFTAELYPTVIRNLGVGTNNIPAGIALISVPYLWKLAAIHDSVPMGLIGGFGVVGGLVVLLLPETGHRPLSGTINQKQQNEKQSYEPPGVSNEHHI